PPIRPAQGPEMTKASVGLLEADLGAWQCARPGAGALARKEQSGGRRVAIAPHLARSGDVYAEGRARCILGEWLRPRPSARTSTSTKTSLKPPRRFSAPRRRPRPSTQRFATWFPAQRVSVSPGATSRLCRRRHSRKCGGRGTEGR